MPLDNLTQVPLDSLLQVPLDSLLPVHHQDSLLPVHHQDSLLQALQTKCQAQFLVSPQVLFQPLMSVQVEV